MTIEDPELDEAVKAATGGVFGAFARWVLVGGEGDMGKCLGGDGRLAG